MATSSTDAGQKVTFPNQGRRLKLPAWKKSFKLGKNGFSTNLLWSLFAEGLTLIGMLLSGRIVASKLGVAFYGDYTAIYAVIGFALSTCTIWTGPVIIQWICREKENPQKVFRSVLTFLCILSLIGMTIVLSVGSQTSRLSIANIAALASAELIGSAALIPLTSFTQAVISIQACQTLRIIITICKTSTLILLSTFSNITFTRLGLSMLFTQISLWIPFSIWIYKKVGYFPRPGKAEMKHLKTGTSFMVTVGSYALYEEGDKIVLGNYPQFKIDTGLYGLAYRIARLGAVPLNALEQATHISSASRGTLPWEHVRRAVRYTLLAAAYGIFYTAFLNIAGPFIISVFDSKRQFTSAITQLRWLSPLILLRGCRNFSDNALLGLGRLNSRMTMNIGSAVFSMLLYVIFIPRYSWKGAWAATFITETLLVITSWALVIMYQRHENRELALTAAAPVAASS
jgi:O-antigen/teichoic acid export membrane protein